MKFSIFETDETMGADSASSGTATYDGTATAPNVWSNAEMSERLRSLLTSNGYGVLSASVTRPGAGARQANFRVVFDWACNDTNRLRLDLESNAAFALAADYGTTSARLVGTTGCKAPAAPKVTPKAKDDPAEKPPVDPKKLTWEQWFEKYQMPIIGGGVVLILLMRR